LRDESTMSYQVLARKWRPRGFAEVVGQESAVRALVNALDGQRLHHAYLFSGTRGVGKTTLARILAKCLNCEQGVSARPCGACAACREVDEGRFVDLIEVDAASRTKVEDTRDLLENVPYAPTRGRFKVYLIDEVHMLSTHSFNALLKTLEEPPPHVKFLLATTDPQRLPATILSRCLQLSLKRLPTARIAEHLARVTAAEGTPAEAEALAALAAAADGSVRDALSLLDQAIAFGGGAVRSAEVAEMLGALDRGAVLGLLEALAADAAPEALRRAGALADQVPDLDAVLAGLAATLHRVALLQVLGEAGPAEPGDPRLGQLASRLAPEDVQLWYQIALIGRRDLPLAPDPRTALEMALLRMLAFRPQEEARAPGDRRTAPQARELVRRPRAADAGSGPRPAGAATPAGEWASVVARLPVGGLVRELAANSVLVAAEGGTVRLRIGPSHAQMRSPAREAQLARALAAHYGEPVRLVVEVGEGAEESPAQVRQRHAVQQREAATRALEGDPTVKSLRELFGATLVQESVRPDGGDEEPEEDPSGAPGARAGSAATPTGGGGGRG
jgi:DNA polymerase-3 subunit gamma/tau